MHIHTLVSDFQPLKVILDIIFPLFKPLSLKYFAMEA